MKHIGIYSGTFDPIHEGHVLFAQTVIEQLGLDKVVFIPEPKPRRKQHVTDVAKREAMVRIALQEYDQMELLSLPEQESHSVIDTMSEVIKRYPEDAFVLIMGSDVFEHIGSWKDYEELKDTVSIVVGLRGEDDGEIVVPMASELGLQASFIPAPLTKISSSNIRSAIAASEQPKGLHDQVALYAQAAGLYEQ